jgi:hypothetical protein
MESKEKDVIENNIEQILQNCTISDIDVGTLPLIDIEYYFLHLRARSVGEVIESKYKSKSINEKPFVFRSKEYTILK